MKFHQPEKSKCLLLRLFLSMCRPCSMIECRPFRLFRCVQTYMGMMNKSWFGICLIKKERERWCLCNLLFLRPNTWFLCSRKADFFGFKWQWMFSLRGADLQDSKQRGRPKMFTCYVLENIFLMSFFEWWLSLKELLHNIAVLLLIRFIPYYFIFD